ncbi:hypothetical protein LTR08_003586 [Meristemomyces frigidus]|nr:hypothetical protein LTR08_003586 [Meristemomyces frigidus]
MAPNAVAVSAPGKVLLAGGYLVLDRAYTGLVFGLDARIHVIVQDIATRNGVTLNEIIVTSPQFQDAVWEYGYRLTERDGGIQVTPLRVDATLKLNRNVFVETALGYTLTYIASITTPNVTPASITILADNDYYSTPTSLSAKSGAAPRFHNLGVPISKANKTGLGSSAALVTAFTAALLTYYLPKETIDLSTDSGKRKLHNLAQASHCAAQGKVGSGFDIASAVYGSCLYKRFSPDILSHHVEPGQPKFASQLRHIVDETDEADRWDTEIRKDEVKLPKGLRLVMCDVSCGSQTPGMVKQVLAWRKENADEANAIWQDLQNANDSLAKELRALAESDTRQSYEHLKQGFARIRELIRRMSERSGVPIEPSSQTELIDACEAIPGVVGGVVPGAGGYDAISLLVEDNETTLNELAKLLSGWTFKSEASGQPGDGRVSMLDVREEMVGVRAEDATSYQG